MSDPSPPTGLRVYNGNISERDNTDGTMITQNDLALVWTAPSDNSAVSYKIRKYSIDNNGTIPLTDGKYIFSSNGHVNLIDNINVPASQVATPIGKIPLFGKDPGMGYNAPSDSSGNILLTGATNTTIFSFTHSYLFKDMRPSLLFTVTSVNSAGSESLPIACVFDTNALIQYNLSSTYSKKGVISLYSKPDVGDYFLITKQTIFLTYPRLSLKDTYSVIEGEIELPLVINQDINDASIPNIITGGTPLAPILSPLNLESIYIMDGLTMYFKFCGVEINFKSHQSMSFKDMGYVGYPETSIPDHYHKINTLYNIHMTTPSTGPFFYNHFATGNVPDFSDPNTSVSSSYLNNNNPTIRSGDSLGFMEFGGSFDYKDSSGNIYRINLSSGFTLSEFTISYINHDRGLQNSNNIYNYSRQQYGNIDSLITKIENFVQQPPYNIMNIIDPYRIVNYTLPVVSLKDVSSDSIYETDLSNFNNITAYDKLQGHLPISVNNSLYTDSILCLSPFTLPTAGQVVLGGTSGILEFNMEIKNYTGFIPLNDFTITCTDPAITVPPFTLADISSIDIIKYNIKNKIPVNNGAASFITTDTSGNKTISYMYQLKVNGLEQNKVYQFQITPKPKLLAGETVSVPFDYLYYNIASSYPDNDTLYNRLFNGLKNHSYYWLSPLPPAPTNVQATLKSLGIATVTWNAPTPLIAPLSSYTVPLASYTVFTHPLIDASGVTVLADSSGNVATTVDYPGLALGTSYKFTVIAATAVSTNPEGTSRMSLASPLLKNAIIPNAPLNLSYTVINPNEIKFFWKAPSGKDTGGSPITGYVLNAAGLSGMPLNLGSLTSYTLSGFSGLPSCIVSLYSKNAIGQSASPVVETVYLAGPSIVGNPPAPIITNNVTSDLKYLLSANKPASVNVSWTNLSVPSTRYVRYYIIEVYKASAPGVAIYSFPKLYYVPNNSKVSSRPATLTYNVDNLLYGRSYMFGLKCVLFLTNGNTYDSEISGPISTAFTPTTTCGPVTNVKFSLNSSKDLIVSWKPPVNTGGLPITGYKISYRSKTSSWRYPFTEYSINNVTSGSTSLTILRSKSLNDFVSESGLPALYASYMKSCVGVYSINIVPLNAFNSNEELVSEIFYSTQRN